MLLKIHRKSPVPKSLFKKVTGSQSETLLKKTPAQTFSCEYYKIIKNLFNWIHLGDCFIIPYRIEYSEIRYRPINIWLLCKQRTPWNRRMSLPNGYISENLFELSFSVLFRIIFLGRKIILILPNKKYLILTREVNKYKFDLFQDSLI